MTMTHSCHGMRSCRMAGCTGAGENCRPAREENGRPARGGKHD